jgi:3-hydroxybutyrate dehydrogenase
MRSRESSGMAKTRKHLAGKLAVVTGSTSGIGLGIARALAADGAHIMLNGFGNATEIEKLRLELCSRHHVDVIYSAADMSKADEIAGLIDQAKRQFGGVDILVNNAGIQHTAPVHEFPSKDWDAIIAINLSAAFYGIRFALGGMIAKNWGRIINVASTHGLVASVNKVAYVAAKHGLVGMTKVVALETARSNITCNAICPGWVLTPLVQNQIDQLALHEKLTPAAAREQLLGEKQPSLQFVSAEQIGATAAFLCSDAASQIRGIALPIDGGWTAQ